MRDPLDIATVVFIGIYRLLIAAFVVAFFAFALFGCSPISIPCDIDAYCGAGGACLVAPSGARWCATTDATCAGGFRWQASAGDSLAGACAGDLPDMTLSPADAAYVEDLARAVDATAPVDMTIPPDMVKCGMLNQPCCRGGTDGGGICTEANTVCNQGSGFCVPTV